MGQGQSSSSCAQCGGKSGKATADGKCGSCGAALPPRKAGLLFSSRKTPASATATPQALKKRPSRELFTGEGGAKFSPERNYALVFVKPTVPKTDLVRSELEKHFAGFKVQITSEGTLRAEEIAAHSIIDKHYFALASNAMDLAPASARPAQLTPELADKFKQEFGVEYHNPTTVLTLGQFLQQSAVPAAELDAAWTKAPKLKIAGGFYVGRLEALEEEGKGVCPSVRPLLVINGFYNSMRSDYVQPGNDVLFFTVEWASKDLSWKDFRGKCIGATNPQQADPLSLRGRMLHHWQAWGLPSQPDVTRNCVHASAGPIEAMRERCTWVQFPLADDPFAKLLAQEGGVPMSLVQQCFDNAPVTVPGGEGEGDGEARTGPAFDVFEDVDSSQVIAQLKRVASSSKL